MRIAWIKWRESAVSPVVGVMLMVVVTIIIAAVVSGFAGGLTSGQTKPPVATLDVQLIASENTGGYPGYGTGYYVPAMIIKHMGGDVIATKNTKIVTSFKDLSTGDYVQGKLSGTVAVPGKSEWYGYLDSQYCAPLYINDVTRFPDVITTDINGTAAWFGNESAVLRPGDVMVAPQGYCGNYNDNSTPSNLHINVGLNNLTGINCTDSATGFISGGQMEVTFIDIPSGKTIYSKEVTIQ